MTNPNPFHKGEQQLQRLAGEQKIATKVGELIRNFVPPQALEFISQQSVIWIGIEDQDSLLWSFPLFGSPGFINPGEGKIIKIDLDKHSCHPGEWLVDLNPGKAIGCLCIDLATRRRIRINGMIKYISQHQLQIEVKQSYPNCPKYIRRREIQTRPEHYKFHSVSSGIAVNSQIERLIAQSDTAYVSSSGPNGADISHRGGTSGFIKYKSPDTIIVPDYRGNSMFNTLGNFKVNPQGGLTIVDYNQNYFLQITGKVNLFIKDKNPGIKTGGTNRFWELSVHRWQLFQLEEHVKWNTLDFSPHNP